MIEASPPARETLRRFAAKGRQDVERFSEKRPKKEAADGSRCH
jgi:hypothetical protein